MLHLQGIFVKLYWEPDSPHLRIITNFYCTHWDGTVWYTVLVFVCVIMLSRDVFELICKCAEEITVQKTTQIYWRALKLLVNAQTCKYTCIDKIFCILVWSCKTVKDGCLLSCFQPNIVLKFWIWEANILRICWPMHCLLLLSLGRGSVKLAFEKYM